MAVVLLISVHLEEADMGRRARRPLSEAEQRKLDEVKLQLCLTLRRSMARMDHYSSTRLAIMMGTSRACVSKVQCARIEELTFNQLFGYLVRLEPNFKILISI